MTSLLQAKSLENKHPMAMSKPAALSLSLSMSSLHPYVRGCFAPWSIPMTPPAASPSPLPSPAFTSLQRGAPRARDPPAIAPYVSALPIFSSIS